MYENKLNYVLFGIVYRMLNLSDRRSTQNIIYFSHTEWFVFRNLNKQASRRLLSSEACWYSARLRFFVCSDISNLKDAMISLPINSKPNSYIAIKVWTRRCENNVMRKMLWEKRCEKDVVRKIYLLTCFFLIENYSW